MTATNTITGTPRYMAPESILDPESADARADLYALGAVAYFLLAGTEVFDGTSLVEICSQHIHEKPKPPSSRGASVPAELEAIVLACLEKDPDQRPRSAAELRARLEACDVDPWESDDAQTWWTRHRAALVDDSAPLAGESRTIGIDGAPRSTAAG